MIRISEYDEAQGLTDEMARSWLIDHGYTEKQNETYLDRFNVYIPGEIRKDCFLFWWPKSVGFHLHGCVECIISHERKSVQQILRKMNPRMRKGCPSAAALATSAFWIVSVNPGFAPKPGLDVWSAEYLEAMRPALEKMDVVSCWPCDNAGNKTPWPEKDGVML